VSITPKELRSFKIFLASSCWGIFQQGLGEPEKESAIDFRESGRD